MAGTPALEALLTMLQRMYVNNYRCLMNFELTPQGTSSALLVGVNGVGKSTVSRVLRIFQLIGRGTNKIKQLVEPVDFAFGNSAAPMRFELKVLIKNKRFQYELAFELPEGFRELRVLEEKLTVDEKVIYSREVSQVTLSAGKAGSRFSVDWHLIALPIIQGKSQQDPLAIFKLWLSHIAILSLNPGLMTGRATGDTLELASDGTNFGDWFTGILSRYPAAYRDIDDQLRAAMPDLSGVRNEIYGPDLRRMLIGFKSRSGSLELDFKELSDGEKCHFAAACLMAANQYYGPLLCFWDEPANYLSLAEAGQLTLALRRAFDGKGFMLVASHSEEVIRRFSPESTFVLTRRGHLEPAQIQCLEDTEFRNDVIEHMIAGDLSFQGDSGP